MPYFDWLVVGAGLYGATFARMMTDAGKRCLVIDRREYVAGNCHDSLRDEILVPTHGAHHFHTNDARIWDFVNRFTSFTDYQHKLLVDYDGRRFSFPPNLMTFHQLWGVRTADEASAYLVRERHGIPDPQNFEEWVLSQVGDEIYRTFYYGYTKKQWGREPGELPASIARRIPIRMTYDDRYFSDRYQGMPVGGYTKMVERMLDGIDVEIGIDYQYHREVFDLLADRVLYTGPLDRLFEYVHGELGYRTLRFEHETREGDFQGIGTVNYTSAEVPYTRILEHKHYYRQNLPHTIITREYPSFWYRDAEPYYPINTEQNQILYGRYLEMVDQDKMLVGGRLARYQYIDMDQAVGAAMVAANRVIANHGNSIVSLNETR